MAINYKESDYARNKYSKGLVYTDVNDVSEEVTYERCLLDDPELTIEKFNEIKEYSDGNYHKQLNAEKREEYNAPYSLDVNKDTNWTATRSLEEEFFQEEDPTMDEIERVAYEILPQVQCRRFLLYKKHQNYETVAELEGVSIPAVWKTVDKAMKKIKKFFELGG